MAPDCNSQSLLFTGKSFMIPKYKKGNPLNTLVDVRSSKFQIHLVHVEVSTRDN